MNDSPQNKPSEPVRETILRAANGLQMRRLYYITRDIILVLFAAAILALWTTMEPMLEQDLGSFEIRWGIPLYGILLIIAITLILVSAFVIREDRIVRERFLAIKDSLSDIKSLEAIRYLTPWLESRDRTAREMASRKLAALLSTMRASDGHLLTDCDHHLLNRQLGGGDINLIHSILTAYRQVGDERDTLVVRYLSEGLDSAKQNPKVRQAAAQCLTYVESRAETNRASQTLLRPSNHSTDPSDILVRPASSMPSVEPDKLVRPAEVNAGMRGAGMRDEA